MIKRKLLGQHFLKSKHIANFIVSEAKIKKDDVVLEVGTGHGILTPLLCQNAGKVISVEADKELYEKAKLGFSNLKNLEMIYGDGFKTNYDFSIFVSNLPYSKSKEAIEWLAQKKFSHGIIMVQKEFAEKLLETSKSRRAISVIANHSFKIKKIKKVGKNNFSPVPKIDSIILEITKKNVLSEKLILIINKIFSYRRKTLQNIFKQFDKKTEIDKRLDDLSGDDIIEIAKKLGK